MSKIITYQAPNGETAAMTVRTVAIAKSLGLAWPRNSQGEEYCTVSHGVHDGEPTHVVVETMPEHLRDSHRAAGNWGDFPFNGAEREILSVEDAEDLIESDDDGYNHIVD